MSDSERLPLRLLLGFALTTLGWRPADFWAATPCELQAAVEALGGAERRETFAAFKRQVETGGTEQE